MNQSPGRHSAKQKESLFSFIGNNRKSEKSDEKGNWLGNVNVIISDKKFGVDSSGDGVADYYKADVRGVNDYYPGGSPMPGRTFNPTEYRFGFNGKEKVDEISGSGNTFDYGFRIYNPRLNRFLSVDPLTKNFAMLSPYQFASNNPIWAVDLDGLEAVLYIINFEGSKISTTKIQLENAGYLGNGVSIRTNKGGSTTYFYGNEISSGNGESFTKSYEGKELKSYNDQYGNLTVGYGHLLSSDEQKTYPEGTAITQDQADTWFSSDYSSIQTSVQNNKVNNMGLTGTQENAAVDFYYNVGPNNKADLKGSGKCGDFFLGYMAGGAGIWKRRFGEKLLYEEGKYFKFDRVDSQNNRNSLETLYKCNPPEREPTTDFEQINPGAVEFKGDN